LIGQDVPDPVFSATPVTASQLPILRAAYSDRTAALRAKLADLAYTYPREGSVGGDVPVVPDTFTALGFTKISYFHTTAHNGWAYVAEGTDLIAIVFRRTQSTQDWRTDLHFRMVRPEGGDKNLWVHVGFMEAFNSLDDGKGGIREKVEELKARQVPIYLAGHSLGGALAQIGCAVLGCDQIAACYTFGSPRVGNKYFDLWVKPPSYRVVNFADIVPQVPWFGFPFPPQLYVHSGDIRYLPRKMDGLIYRYQPNFIVRGWQLILASFSLAEQAKYFASQTTAWSLIETSWRQLHQPISGALNLQL
jgi:triacylglycerol lipase